MTLKIWIRNPLTSTWWRSCDLLLCRDLHYRLRTKSKDNRIQVNALLYLAAVLLSTSCDIQRNPGPTACSPDNTEDSRYPCGACEADVTWNDKALRCDTCECWFHIHCENIGAMTYGILDNSNFSWHCVCCGTPNYSRCLFNSTTLLIVSSLFRN